MLLADIKTLLTDISPVIFIAEIPDTPDNLLGVFFSGGYNPEWTLDSKAFDHPTFQVRIRDKSALTAIERAEAVKDALDGQIDLTIGSTRYLSIFQQGDILPLGKDSKGRTEYSLNFAVKYQR